MGTWNCKKKKEFCYYTNCKKKRGLACREFWLKTEFQKASEIYRNWQLSGHRLRFSRLWGGLEKRRIVDEFWSLRKWINNLKNIWKFKARGSSALLLEGGPAGCAEGLKLWICKTLGFYLARLCPPKRGRQIWNLFGQKQNEKTSRDPQIWYTNLPLRLEIVVSVDPSSNMRIPDRSDARPLG